jgi:type IV secretory pathway TrbD component
VSADSCPRCGNDVPQDARFCPNCGLAVPSGYTVVDELPQDETGPVPVHRMTAEPRLFGVTPPETTLILGLAALAASIVLFAVGGWLLGFILLFAAVALLAAFFTHSRRHRETALTRGAAKASDSVLALVRYLLELLRVRSRAERELLLHRRSLKRATGERELLLRELGEAVYRKDETATDSLRARIGALDDSIERTEKEMQAIVTRAEEQVQEARLEVQPTQIETPEQPEVPEPYPPPGETDPPRQPQIPEPYPPPGELDPPAPPEVPEPYPPQQPDER